MIDLLKNCQESEKRETEEHYNGTNFFFFIFKFSKLFWNLEINLKEINNSSKCFRTVINTLEVLILTLTE